MANDYSIWLVSPNGTRLLLIDRFMRVEYTLTVNTFGVAKIDLPPTFDLNRYAQEDSRVEIWRQVPGGQKYVDGQTVWLVRDWDEILSQQGNERISLIAYSANETLDRPIVAYPSGSSQASKDDFADDMMKEIVRENLGSSATDTERDLSAYLSVAANLSAGPTISKSIAWRNVLSALKELAQKADEQETPVFFGVTYDQNSGQLTFETSTLQWGVDHSGSDDRVVLSPGRGTLGDVQRSYISSNERNYVYVGGQNQGEARTIVEDSNADRIAVSPLNRRELFVDARTTNNTQDELEAEAGAALRNFRVRETFNAKIRDSSAVRYGREYGFGDRVLAEFHSRVVPTRIDSIRVLLERGKEDIRANLRFDG